MESLAQIRTFGPGLRMEPIRNELTESNSAMRRTSSAVRVRVMQHASERALHLREAGSDIEQSLVAKRVEYSDTRNPRMNSEAS
eukprot:1868459-Pleurochrysis_carterae.AAC.1